MRLQPERDRAALCLRNRACVKVRSSSLSSIETAARPLIDVFRRYITYMLIASVPGDLGLESSRARWTLPPSSHRSARFWCRPLRPAPSSSWTPLPSYGMSKRCRRTGEQDTGSRACFDIRQFSIRSRKHSRSSMPSCERSVVETSSITSKRSATFATCSCQTSAGSPSMLPDRYQVGAETSHKCAAVGTIHTRCAPPI